MAAESLRHADGNTTRECHVTFAVQQTLASEVNGHERGGACGLNAKTRPFQIQAKRDLSGEVVSVVPNDNL